MITQAIGNLFGQIMYVCYKVLHSYGISIIIFTIITKIILMPISIMVQKNSIKMVKMYPEMNRIKAKYFGSKDLISEEQYKLYQKEKYHPMLDLVPVILQLIILMGVVDVIYRPISHLLHISKETVNTLVNTYCGLSGVSPEISSIQIQIVDSMKNSAYIEAYRQVLSEDILNAVAGIDMNFWGINLGAVPSKVWGITIMIPLLAAMSSWLMCFVQNKANVLQSEQGKVNQITTLLLSVGLSLYLGFFVPAGVGAYWILSNLIAILTLFMLNACINPKKYIDYEDLASSKSELDKVQKYSASGNKKRHDEYSRQEAQDYKRFQKYGGKQLVFYSEKNGFYKYYQNVIETILSKTDIIIHYITGDPKDEVFALASDQFRVYYIGENKLIVLMMKMEADMVVMTMPDLQKYHIKRSIIKEDIEYVYLDHGIGSDNLTLRKHALDYFDTIFASNEIGKAEIRAQEKCYGLKPKNIVEFGSCLIDNMIEAYKADSDFINERPTILIAPSWQDKNILESGIYEILGNLLGKGYHIVVRPHPQYVRHFEDKLLALAEQYADQKDFELQMDFSSNETVFRADVLVTDWSSIAYEYSFTTLKPTLFVNTPMKIMNPDYEEIGVCPFDIEIRNKIGISIDMNQLNEIGTTIEKLLNDRTFSKDEMRKIRKEYLYNVGTSGEVGAKYIIRKLIEYSKR
ncbi:MAG: membrane protein insertase YidC [Lachnospiraceae bacterium]|nr:membrane protein insertase YidC [Lachnospiraceae bacterium]